MTVRKICCLPEAVLRQKAKKVPKVDASIRRLIGDMVETMIQAEGVGLAAPQVGISLRVAVLQMPEEEPVAIVNPKVVKRAGERPVMEGCLSVPGYQGEVKRSVSIIVKGLDQQGKEIRIKATGLMAQALEHEIDHLNGMLYVDRIDDEAKLYKIEPEKNKIELEIRGSMPANKKTKTLVQCDFDGTITEKDVSFLILDAFADGDWRKLLDEYKGGRISVGSFNTRAFNMVKVDKATLQEFVKEKVRIREGLPELLELCRSKGFRFVIVSNGLEFYIDTILRTLDINDIEVFAARAAFDPSGIKASYIGPDGSELQNDFKKAYIRRFLEDNYRIIYIGNGASDVPSARLADHIFATDAMLAACRQMNIECTPFASLNDIVKGMEPLT